MHELARRLEASGAEAAILATPHGTLLDGHFGVVRSARLTEHPNQFVDAAHLYEGDGDPELADACVRALQAAGLPALGLTFGTTAAGGSTMPIDWGAGIPLTFLRRPGGRSSRRAAPCRTTTTSVPGEALALATGDRPVAFVASADHGHGHTPRRPVRLQRALGAVRRRRAGRRAAERARRARRAGTRSGRRTRSPTASGRC